MVKWCIQLAWVLFLPLSELSFAESKLETPEQILNSLSDSLREQSYSGSFTYEYGGNLTTLQISHAVFDGIEYERVFFLNGPERELIRSGRSTECETLGGFLLKGGTLSLANGFSTRLNQHYKTVMAGYDRVANRDARVIQILPKDNMRNGLTISVDQETGLLLRALVTSPSNQHVERIQFITLENRSDLQLKDFKSNDALFVGVNEKDCLSKNNAIEAKSPWRPTWIPSGFVLSNVDYTDRDGYVESYTDGLATFSVFVNPDPQAFGKVFKTKPAGQAEARRGATIVVMQAFTDANRQVFVTIVGEIPSATARKISLSMSKLRS